MSESVVPYISLLADGDGDVAQKLWDDYFQRMVRLARWRLECADIPKGDFDEEDVAICAMTDFYQGMARHEFGYVHNEVDLWRLLFKITVRKVSARRRYYFAEKRGSGQVLDELALTKLYEREKEGLAGVVGKQPTPEQELSGQENLQQMLEQLQNETLHQIALMMLDGVSTKEIAAKLVCSPQTVYNKLEEIRHIMLVYITGMEPTQELMDDVLEECQSQLNRLDKDHRKVAEDWLKGYTPREIADKLGCTPATINSKLGRIARIWEKKSDV